MFKKRRTIILSTIVFAAAGALISYTLAERFYFGGPGGEGGGLFSGLTDQVCGESRSFFNCDGAAKSRFAVLFNIPLALYGMFLFLTVFFTGIADIFIREELKKYTASVLLWASSFASIFNLVLLFISLFIIKSLCPLCLITYIASWLILAVLLIFFKGSSAGYFNAGSIISSLRSENKRISFIIILIIIILSSALSSLAGNFYLSGAKKSAEQQKIMDNADKVLREFAMEPVIQINYDKMMLIGDPNAPVTIVEVTDFLCPYCSIAAEVMEEVLKENPGKVKIYLINYPLDISCNPYIKNRMHEGACDLAKGSICAAEQGKLDKYMAYAFLMKERVKDPDLMKILANLCGGNVDKWIKSFSSQETARTLGSHMDAAKAINVTGTPRIYINNKRYNGKPVKEYFNMLINAEIERMKKEVK